MNNPYRARPGKPRVDHASALNYGVPNNNNTWPSMPTSQVGPPPMNTNVYQSQVTNEPQVSNIHSFDDGSGEDDSWNWDSGNADTKKDAWNWSIDQSAELQAQRQHQQFQQHHQQQQQQQHQPQQQQPQQFQHQQQPVPIQSRVPLSYQNQGNFNMNYNSNNFPIEIPVQQSTDKHVFNNAHSDPLSQYPKYSTNEQTENLSHSNFTKDNLSSVEQAQWQSMDQQFNRNSPPKLSMPVQSFNQQSHGHQQQELPDTNNYNWNRKPENLMHENQNQSRKTSLDRQANQWPNEQHATQLYENVHSSSLQRPQNSKSPLESVNLSQSWQSNTTQHSEVKNELNESIVNDGFINTNQSWQRSDLAQSFTPSTGYMPGNVLNTSEPTGSQDDQTSQLANDIQMLNIKQADFELENVSLQDSNNDNRSRLLTSDSIVEKNLNTEGNFNQSKTVEVPPPNVNQSNFNQQFQNFNTYPTESKAFVTSQWPSAPKSPEIVTPATQETVYHQPEPSALAQSNATFNNSNVPQVPITSVSLQPLNYSLGYENRIDHQQLESSNFGENFVGIQQPHEPEQVSQYQNQQVDESKNSSIIQQQNTEIEQPGSVLNSSQSDLQYRQNDTIQSPGLDQWYNQIGPQSAPSIHYDDKNRSQLQAQSQVELQRPPQNPTTDTYNYVQPSMGHQNQNIDTQKSHDISSKLSTSETLQIDSDSSTMKIHNLQNPIQAEPSKQSTDSYEFASNDRNTFLETGELTDSHHESNSKTPSQDDDNDEITNDIPFLREVPGQSSSVNQQRNSPAGRNQYSQSIPRLSDVRRTEPFGHNTSTERVDFRDIPSGQEKHKNGGGITRESDVIERRNDPSGRERSLPPPVQLRNEPSGEQRIEQQQQQQQQSLTISQGQKNREDTESDNENESGHSTSEMSHQSRQIPGETYMDEAATSFTETSRIVTGSQGTTSHVKQSTESSKKREEAVGASINEEKVISSSPKRRNSYIDRDDESDNSPDDEIIERKKESSPINSSRYDYEKKIERNFYDRERDRELDDDYYYDRVRNDYDRRSYNSRDELDRNDTSFRDGDRRIRDGNERVLRDDDRRGRYKDEAERSMRRRDERQRERRNESRRPKESTTARDYDPGYPRNRDYPDRERRRDERRRGYDDYDSREQRREYCDDGYSRSSRPSSRSSYNDRELDYYMRSRENYYGYNNYSRYEYNQNYYSYWENLRRTNPVAYAEWYHKYYANQQQHQQQQQQQQQQLISHDVSNYREDRGSVHSGRSSCDERNTTGKQTFSELSMIDDLKSTSRMTPTKFSTSHGQGSFSIGSFLHVHASYPADGERARVDLLQINSLLSHDLIVRNLRVYPGPLIKGVTHKKTIIEYCENQIKKASLNDDLNDPASYILLYQLMVMLIQQNGNVVGVDIATLLLKNKESYPYDVNEQSRGIIRRDSVISQRSSGTGGDGSVYNLGHEIEAIVAKPRKTIEQLTEEFRNTLLYGLVQDALEFAMTEGLWGHALFLASKLDKRTHASVMTRFANSLPIQDPLQTLYQLHSGRVPASVTCVADSKWDDWRPHLAMIISNASANPDINCRSIIILGDTLAARGNIYAAHFCYILAQIDFGMNENSNDKLVLIGANHHKNYTDFANPEAIMLTEIYEYARNLSEPGFTIVGLQSFKFEIVQKLIDYGFLEKALLYLEQISINIVNAPSKFKRSFINEVYSVSERIKFHDPIFKDSTSGDDTALVWLNNLARIVDEPQTNEIYHENNVQVQENLGIHNVDQTQQQQQQSQWNYDNRQLEYNSTNLPRIDVPVVDVPEEQWQPSSQINPQDSFNIDQNVNHNSEIYNQYEQQQHQQQQQMDNQIQSSYDQVKHPTNNYDWQQQTNQWSYQPLQTDANSIQEESSGSNYELQPQISMGPSGGKQYDPLEELESLDQPQSQETKSKSESSSKPTDKSIEKKSQASGGGSWLGGLLSKLTPKPKNQMILPDDNNPAITWDPVTKTWMNKDEDSDSNSQRLAAPPKAREMVFQPSQSVEQRPPSHGPTVKLPGEDMPKQNNLKMTAGGGNMFKLQKGRSMRANYVDVMNPGGVKSNGSQQLVNPPTTLTPLATSSPNFFIPSPVNNANTPVDFLTSSPSVIPTEDSRTNNDF